MLKLTIKNGQFEGVSVDVADYVAIGRAQEAGLFLPDPQVSRKHSEIFKEGSLHWVSDNKSHNGTFVNDVKIEGRRVLRHGDIIRIGNTQIEVSAPADATTTGRQKIKYEEEQTEMTMTLERSARDLAPLTLDAIAKTEAPLPGFSFPSIQELRKAPDRAISAVLSNAKRFAILFHVARSLQENTDAGRLLATLMDFVFKIVKADSGAIVLIHPDTRELVPVLSIDKNGKPSDTVRISRTVATRTLNSKMAVISTDARTDPRLGQAESIIMYGMRSIMCVPMISKESVVGLIQVMNERDFAAFGEDDLYLLTVIASLAAVSIENSRLYERQSQALEDLRLAHDALQKTQEELIKKEKLATMGQLSSGIAHEIKNSLGPMALVHLMQERYPDDDVLQEYARMILESHNRIKSIVDEIRDFTKGVAREVQRQRVPLRTMLESVLAFLKFDKDVKKAPVTLSVQQPAEANIDANRLKQVIINLIRNSVHALPEKGGKVEIVLGVEKEMALIRVIDNGCGIPDEIMANIWSPFFTTKEDSGMGLGLHISRQIVEQHEGRLECSSKVGKGTVMSVFLPLAK